MNKVIFLGLLLLSAALPAFAQEQAPALDPAFGIKPFSMGDDFWIIDARPSADGGTYLAGAWHNLTKLDAAGNKLWSAPYTADGSYVDMLGNIAVDGADNVYVGIYDYPQGRIQKYGPGGNLLESYAAGDLVFGVAFNKALNRLYAVFNYYDGAAGKYAISVKMFDENLNIISSVISSAPATTMWAEGGIGLDAAGNVYISGWSEIGTTRKLIGLKYTAALTPLWEYSEPIGSSPFTAGEVIPEGGMYLIREDRGSDPKLLKISGAGVKLWETVVPEDYHYYKGVDKAGNFYGATWAEAYDWLPVLTKYGYEDGIVQWTMLETHSGEIDDIYFDAQARLYTVGSLMEQVGDAENYIARYAGGDTEAPAAVPDLAVTVVSSNSITLSWTAPGDDGITGTAAFYDLRYTIAGPILTDADFTAAAQVPGVTAPQAAGTPETFTLTGLLPGATYFFGIKTADEAGNISGLSNSPQGVTAAIPVEKYSLREYAPPEPHIVTVNAWSESLVSLVNIFGTTNPASGVKVDFSISTWPAGAQGQELSKSTEASVNGLADVLLKLGNIPAEYGVTATCDSCEPSASTATFTCCGKLSNYDFKQFDDSWRSTHYDNICSTVPAGRTGRPVYSCDAPIFKDRKYTKYTFSIGAKGCGLSALATVNNYYRDAYSLSITSTTPLTLNTYLSDNNGYSAKKKELGAVVFDKIENLSNSRIGYLGATTICTDAKSCPRIVTRNDLIGAVNANLSNNNPVIIRVPGHFMLAVGKCGDKYVVSDPGSNQTALYDPNGSRKLIGIRQFKLINNP